MDRRPRVSGRSAARRMSLAAVLLIVLVAVFTAGTLWDRRQRALAGKQRELDNLALVLAEQTERVFETADLALKATIQEQGVPAASGGSARSVLENLLRTRISGIPHIRSLGIVSPEGTVVASTSPTMVKTVGQTQSFRYFREHAGPGAYLWRVTSFPGSPGGFILITRRVAGADGHFAGMVSVSLDPDYFLNLYRTIALEPGEELWLSRDDGPVMAAFPARLLPPPYPMGGEMVPPLPDHEPIVRRERGTREGPAGMQIYARVYLTRFPLHVEARAGRDATLASWRAQTAVIGSVVLVFCALGMLLTLGFYREVGRRELAEHDTAAQTRLFRSVFDTVPHPIFVKDAQGRHVAVNRAMADAWRMEPEEFLGLKVPETPGRAPEEIEANLADDRTVLTEGRDVTALRTTTFPDGRQRKYHVIRRPMRDEAGAVTGVVGTAVDETDRLAAEAELRASQQLLNTVFDSIPVYIWVKDREGRIVHANRSVEGALGTTLERVKGHRYIGTEFRPAEEVQRAMDEDRRVLEQGEVIDVTQWQTARPGVRRLVHLIKSPLRGGVGGISGLVAIAIDVTEHARAEEALRNSQALLQTVFDAIPLSVFVKDLDDRLLVVNPRMAARWNQKPEQLTGKRVTDLDVPADERRAVEESDAQVIREDRLLDYEIERTMPDGQIRRLRAIKAPLHGADGKVNGILGIAEDITGQHRMREEKAELERQLQQVQKMETIGRLAGGVAHDFNNLLTPIIGYVDLARASLEPEHPLQNDLGLIREAASRAAELTRGLLSFSRSQVLTLRAVDLNDEIRSVHKMLRRVIGEGIDILLNLDPALGAVRADATQMHQLLMNLAVNARDAMPNGGKLVIDTANLELDPGDAGRILAMPPGHYVLVSVTDTGTGMDKATQARIFEPFFTTKEPGKGTGLGLSIVYGIVRQHQGTIRCYSEPGWGTSFKVLLPRHDPVAMPPTARRRPLQQLRGAECVLVVEDEPLVRQAVCSQLASLGYDVLQAPAPRDANALLEQQPHRRIALLVADVVMPGQSGCELYADLKRVVPGLNVLYMSGYPRDVLQAGATALGSAPFIGKPFSLHDLAEKVRSVLDPAAGPAATSA